MNPVVAEGQCPFCGRLQVPQVDRLWRCPSCNLFLRGEDLAEATGRPRLEALSRDFCPWCAFPVAREFSLPEDGEFLCAGCGGTLTTDMLETQASIEAWRKKRLHGGGFLLFALALLASIALALWLLSR